MGCGRVARYRRVVSCRVAPSRGAHALAQLVERRTRQQRREEDLARVRGCEGARVRGCEGACGRGSS